MQQYWNDIGPVTRVRNGNTTAFINLKEAVIGLYESQISNLKYGHAKYYVRCHTVDVCMIEGDDYVFYDDCGLAIPVWKIKETYFNISRVEHRAHHRAACAPWARRFWGFVDFRFRDGPVPNLRKGRGGRVNRNRNANVQTTQEIRDNDFLDNFDEDARKYGVKSRPNRRRLPTAWDDRSHGSYWQTNWKHFRKHQWKEPK